MNHESHEMLTSYAYRTRGYQPEQDPLKRAANDSASLVYKLLEPGGSDLHWAYAGCEPSDSVRYQLKDSDHEIAAYYLVEANLDHDLKTPHVLTYNFEVSWFDKPNSDNPLHKIQYRLTYDHFEPSGVVIEPDYKTELLKTGEAPQLVQRAMELQDYQDLQQFASYILAADRPSQTVENSL